MPSHKVVRDYDLFRRIKKDAARHNEKLRDAIKNNLSKIITSESIITADRNKTVRVPIRQLKNWQFIFNSKRSTVSGHGDGKGTLVKKGARTKLQCPHCGGIFDLERRYVVAWGEDFCPSCGFSLDDKDIIIMAASNDKDKYAEGKTGKRRTIPGDLLGKEDKQGGGQGGPQGGEDAGEEFYETDVAISEVEKILFEELGLPFIEDKGNKKIKAEKFKFDDIVSAGPISHLAKRASIKRNIKRNASLGIKGFKNVWNEDLRYHSWEIEEEQESCAAIFCLMDSSGSMDEDKKFLARSFYLWMVRFIQSEYDNVDIIFINHHTEAKEVTEEEFFKRGESGGTKFSSAYRLALDIMRDRYNPSDWNTYLFHFSDGENWYGDNDKLFPIMKEILDYPCNLMGYGEISDAGENAGGSLPSWWQTYSALKDMEKQFGHHERFITTQINSVNDIKPALKKFFDKDKKVK